MLRRFFDELNCFSGTINFSEPFLLHQIDVRSNHDRLKTASNTDKWWHECKCCLKIQKSIHSTPPSVQLIACSNYQHGTPAWYFPVSHKNDRYNSQWPTNIASEIKFFEITAISCHFMLLLKRLLKLLFYICHQ